MKQEERAESGKSFLSGGLPRAAGAAAGRGVAPVTRGGSEDTEGLTGRKSPLTQGNPFLPPLHFLFIIFIFKFYFFNGIYWGDIG